MCINFETPSDNVTTLNPDCEKYIDVRTPIHIDASKADKDGNIIYDIPAEEITGEVFVLDPVKHEKYRRKNDK